MELFVYETTTGDPHLRIEDEDEHGPFNREIPLAAIASWRELLGIDDPVEVVEAIIHVQDHGEPDPDPETGVQAWTAPYELLRVREQAREDAAVLATEEEGSLPASVRVKSSAAAYSAVHVPIGDGECAMDRCRRDARKELGVADPEKRCGVVTRLTEPVITPPDSGFRVAGAFGPLLKADQRKQECAAALAGREPELVRLTQAFLHSLTDHQVDLLALPPLEPDEPEPVRPVMSAADLVAAYDQQPADQPNRPQPPALLTKYQEAS